MCRCLVCETSFMGASVIQLTAQKHLVFVFIDPLCYFHIPFVAFMYLSWWVVPLSYFQYYNNLKGKVTCDMK